MQKFLLFKLKYKAIGLLSTFLLQVTLNIEALLTIIYTTR